MSPAAQWLAIGTPIAVLACIITAIQRRTWQQPPANPKAAAFRATWATILPYAQLGVRVDPDGFVYTNAGNRCLGQAAAATVQLVPVITVGKVKPSTAWAVITFADGTVHRHRFALRNLREAKPQADRFNGVAAQQAQGVFRRTWTAPQHAAQP